MKAVVFKNMLLHNTFSELRTITQKESQKNLMDSHANVVVGIDMEMTVQSPQTM